MYEGDVIFMGDPRAGRDWLTVIADELTRLDATGRDGWDLLV